MKKLTIIFTLVLAALTGKAEDFFFLASEDYLYENPANWHPAYPGTEIQEGDKVVVMSDVFFTGYDIKVEGEFKVMLGARVSSSKGSLRISENGQIDNEGEILVNQVENFGKVVNRISATLNVHDYIAHPGAHTHNSLKATFKTLGSLINNGKFDNYSICAAGQTFENTSVFNQIRDSRLNIEGEMLLSPGSEFNQSDKSTTFLGEVPVHDKIDQMFP